jgi:Uma2 family endonuclease
MATAVAVNRRRFTVDDYHRMWDVGILSPTDRVELIDGEIVTKMPIGPRHGACVDRANRALTTTVGSSAIVRVQGSVRLDLFNLPQPDVVLLRPRADFYASAHPSPADILLIVEVAESSIDFDRSIKRRVYAKAGVREYWLVDLNEDVVHVYSDPSSGGYRGVAGYRREQSITPHLLPALAMSAFDLLGPEPS